jgi:hypothetical protein
MLCVCLPVLASLFCSVLWYVSLASRSSSWFNTRVEVKFMPSERDQSRYPQLWGYPAQKSGKAGNRKTKTGGPVSLSPVRTLEWAGPSSRNFADGHRERHRHRQRQRQCAGKAHTAGRRSSSTTGPVGAVCRRERPTTLATIATAADTGSSNTPTTH